MSKLDFYFPFIVFFYGFFLIVGLDNPILGPQLRRFREQMAPRPFQAAALSPGFLFLMTFVSGLWALQNLLLS